MFEKCYSKSRQVRHQVTKEVYNSIPSVYPVTTKTKNGIYEVVELLEIKQYVKKRDR